MPDKERNPLHGIHEGSDVDISKYEWLGISRKGYDPSGLKEQKIDAAVLAKRERCARVAEEYNAGQDARDIAAAIRSGK